MPPNTDSKTLTSRNDVLFERAKRVIPGGVNSPVRKCLQRALKNFAAAATVSSMSAAVCAALTKPASYRAGA